MDLHNDLYSISHPDKYERVANHVDVRMGPKEWPKPYDAKVPYYAIMFDSPFEKEVSISLHDLYDKGWAMRIIQRRYGSSFYIKMMHPKYKLALKFKVQPNALNAHQTSVYEFLKVWSEQPDHGATLEIMSDDEMSTAWATGIDRFTDEQLLAALNARSASRLEPLDTSKNTEVSAKVLAFKQVA